MPSRCLVKSGLPLRFVLAAMQDRMHHNRVIVISIENDLRKYSHHGMADVFLNDRVSTRLSLNTVKSLL